ncbi:MAG: ABC transporter permease [Chloroflexota bacterium]|nr:ABC transporter permease [Chloroflexota bacterium]
MLGQIANLALKEFLQVRRDRVLMIFLIFGPLLQFLLLAQTTGSGFRHVPMGVVDQDKSSLSRQAIAALDNAGDLDLRYYVPSSAALGELMDQGKVRLGVVFRPRFGAMLSGGETATVQVLADGTSYLEAGTALRVAQGVLADFVQKMISERVGPGLGGAPEGAGAIALQTMIQFNPTLNVRLHTNSAQISFILFQISLVVAALSIARERELGTLEQLRITPIGQMEMILGKSVLAMVVSLLNFGMLFLFGLTVFQIPMRGSMLDLLVLTLLFLVANVAMGMIISVLCANQQQALLFVFLACVLEVNVSGYLLSVNNMPPAFQFIAEFTPLRHYMSIVREIMLKGATLAMLSQHAVALALQAGVSGAIVWVLLRRTD